MAKDLICVNDEEAQKIANEHKMEYIKTSAYTGENVKQMVDNMINQVF